MTTNSIVLVCIAVLLVAIGILSYLFFKISRSIQAKPFIKKVLPVEKNTDIEELVKFASDNALGKNELSGIVQIFIEQMNIPPKNGDKIPKEADIYLNFIMLICSHKNSDAKLITYLNTQSKKKNQTYAVQIDEYEKRGIEARKTRK